MTVNKKTITFAFLALVTVLVVVVVLLRPAPQNITLRFHPFVGDNPFLLNTQSYQNPGGDGEFTVRDFQLFISNIVLSSPTNQINEQESYHLLRFDGNSAFDQIVIPQIKLRSHNQLSFGIGVDPKANGSLMFSGDLDPNSRMAWNWQVGYKFLLLEGTLTVNKQQLPLVYHIGFDESYTELNFDIANKIMPENGVINFKIDLQRLFQKDNSHDVIPTQPQLPQDIEYIDMYKMSHVKFSPEDVKSIANGFNHFITIM